MVCAKLLQLCLTLCDPMNCIPPVSSVHGILQTKKKKTEMGCLALLQGIFPTQGSNPCLLHLLCWQVNCLPLVPSGKPQWDQILSSSTWLSISGWCLTDTVYESSSILSGRSDLFPLFSASFILFSPSVLTSDVISFINSLTGYILHFCVLI